LVSGVGYITRRVKACDQRLVITKELAFREITHQKKKGHPGGKSCGRKRLEWRVWTRVGLARESKRKNLLCVKNSFHAIGKRSLLTDPVACSSKCLS